MLTAALGDARAKDTFTPEAWDRRDFLRTAAAALGYLTLGGCGGSGSDSGASSACTVANYKIADITVLNKFSVPAASLASIRARPETFLTAYSALGGLSSSGAFMRSKLGSAFASLTDTGCMAMYGTLVSYNSAPVGCTPLAPIPATMQQLLASSALACGHFCKLTTLFSLLGHPELIPPDEDSGSPPKATAHFIAWLENVPLNTGFHSQLILTNVLDSAYLLLDPTYAYALRVPFVGSGPQASLTAIENAATMLQTPIAQENLVVLNSNGTATVPDMLTTVRSGALGPQYIEHDSIYGSEGWDTRISKVFDTLA
jgi:hypothetical protein